VGRRNKSSPPLSRKRDRKKEVKIMVNRVILEGRLVKDPEVKVLANGTQIAVFSIAVNRKYKNKSGEWIEETNFFDIETYGKLAERVGSQLSKGYKILVEGEIRQEKWQSLSGQKRSKIKIVARKVNLIEKPKSAITKAKKEDLLEEEVAF
jgi:single-strand DNA-binding protein